MEQVREVKREGRVPEQAMAASMEFFGMEEKVKEEQRKGPEYQVLINVCIFKSV